MIKFFSNLEAAMDYLNNNISKELYLTWTPHSRNLAEFRVGDREHINPESKSILYQSEKKTIKKNVKHFKNYRSWTNKN